MKLKITPSFNNSDHRAMTLVEVLIAGAISSGVVGGLICLLVMVSQEQRHELADAILQQEVGYLQDRLSRLVRGMSQSESVIFGDPIQVSGVTLFQSVIVARGKAPEYPREILRYRVEEQVLVHDPNRQVAGDEFELHTPKTGAVLRKMYFFPSLKPGNIPDNSTLNIWFEMDDDGLGQRLNPDGTLKKVAVMRTFTVQMRNH